MSNVEQKEFVVSLFTTIIGQEHSPYPEKKTHTENIIYNTSDSISHLFPIVAEVLKNIIDVGVEQGTIDSVSLYDDRFVPFAFHQKENMSVNAASEISIDVEDKIDSNSFLLGTPLLYTSDAVIYYPNAYLKINPNCLNFNTISRGPSLSLVPLTSSSSAKMSKSDSPIKVKVNESLKVLTATAVLKDLFKNNNITNEDVVSALDNIGYVCTIEAAEKLIAKTNIAGIFDEAILEDIISSFLKIMSNYKKTKKSKRKSKI